MRVHYQGGKLKKQLREADRRGARWAVLLGERERDEGRLGLKDLETGEQRSVDRADLWAHVTGVAALQRHAGVRGSDA